MHSTMERSPAGTVHDWTKHTQSLTKSVGLSVVASAATAFPYDQGACVWTERGLTKQSRHELSDP